MKKALMILMAISLVFAVVAPAMAETAVEFSGRYFVRGTYLDNGGYFSDDDGVLGSGQTLEDHALSWYDQELRMNITFKPNENVSVFLRFDVGDYTWGTQNYFAGLTGTADFDADRVWASIKTPYGILDVGRMAGGQWGLDFGNYGTNGSDRIKFTTAIGDLALGAIIEKRIEADNNLAINAIDDDADFDVYHLFGVYKQETFETGLLLTYARDRRNNTTAVAAPVVVPTPIFTTGANTQLLKVSETDYYNFNLYGIFNFGPFTLQGEVQHEWGDVDWEALGWNDTDLDTWMFNIEAQYAAGPFSAALGFAWVEGQDEDDLADALAGGGGEISAANMANGGVGNDWAPLFIMTDVSAGVNSHNWMNTTGQNMAQPAVASGIELYYLTASYAATETLSFGFAAGIGFAEEEWDGTIYNTDDDYGWEVDLTMSWDAMDNVNYALALAYMDTGDLYAQQVNTSNLVTCQQGMVGSDGEDVWAMRHTLTINF